MVIILNYLLYNVDVCICVKLTNMCVVWPMDLCAVNSLSSRMNQLSKGFFHSNTYVTISVLVNWHQFWHSPFL